MSVTKKVSDLSLSGFPTSLNLFSLPITNVAFTKWAYKEILPMNPVTDSPFIMRHFSDTCWLNMSKVYVQLELQVEKQDAQNAWVPLANTDTEIALTQLVGLTYFKQVKLALNNQEIYDSGTLYPYRAFIANELSCGNSIKRSELRCGGYGITTTYNDVDDDGFVLRNIQVRKGRVQYFTRLDHDFGNQQNLLINDVDVVFTLFPADDRFVLENLSNSICRVVPKSIKMYIQAVDVQPSLNVKFFEMLEKQPVNYAVRKTDLRSYFLSVGRQEADINLHTGTIPRRIILAMVESDAFRGTVRKSPFNFTHFGLKEITVTAGAKTCPAVPYSLDYSQNFYGRAYTDFYNNLGQHFSTANCGITFEQFKNGWNFYVFDLSSSQQDAGDEGFELISTGSTNVKLIFNVPLPPGGVELIAFSEFDSVISIDKYRRVVLSE